MQNKEIEISFEHIKNCDTIADVIKLEEDLNETRI